MAPIIDRRTNGLGPLENYPGAAEQVKICARVLCQAGLAPFRQFRAGLLFTANDGIRRVTGR